MAEEAKKFGLGRWQRISTGPAARAVEVAGAGRVEENGPGDVAVVFCPQRLLLQNPDGGGSQKIWSGTVAADIHHRWCHRGPGNFTGGKRRNIGKDQM